MGIIGKAFLMLVWLVLAVTIIQGWNLSQGQGWCVLAAGLLLILFWGTLKKLVCDWYEDRRMHRNRKKQLDIELQAMAQRVNLAAAQQRDGHERTRELLEFRQQLIQMESAENQAMVRAMMSTLDSVK